MLVYHFMNNEFGLQAVKNKRLKVARIAELNDPFELLGPSLSDAIFRKAFLEMKMKLSTKFGLLCFSKTFNNPVLWSHYADHHRGLCLGFDIPRKNLTQIKYANKRISPDKFLSEDVSTKVAAMIESVSLKFSHWRYENEQRLFVDLDETTKDNQTGLYFYNFCEDLVLKKIILGSNSTVTRMEIAEVQKNYPTEIDAFKTRPAFKSFNVVRNRKESLWQ